MVYYLSKYIKFISLYYLYYLFIHYIDFLYKYSLFKLKELKLDITKIRWKKLKGWKSNLFSAYLLKYNPHNEFCHGLRFHLGKFFLDDRPNGRPDLIISNVVYGVEWNTWMMNIDRVSVGFNMKNQNIVYGCIVRQRQVCGLMSRPSHFVYVYTVCTYSSSVL